MGSRSSSWPCVERHEERERERERTSGGDVNRVGERAAGKKRGETARERGE